MKFTSLVFTLKSGDVVKVSEGIYIQALSKGRNKMMVRFVCAEDKRILKVNAIDEIEKDAQNKFEKRSYFSDDRGNKIDTEQVSLCDEE